MPKDNKTKQNDKPSKKIFKPKPTLDLGTAPDISYEHNVARKKTKRIPTIDVGRVFYDSRLKSEKNDSTKSSEEAPTRRVSDLLKSFSKFDEDIERLRGIGSTSFKSTDNLIEKLSTEDMEKELKIFLLARDQIKSNLDQIVMKVNNVSQELEHEEEKIREMKQQIQLKKNGTVDQQGDKD